MKLSRFIPVLILLTLVPLIISCPPPLDVSTHLQVKDNIPPSITIQSPQDGSYCARTVAVSGTVSDASTVEGTAGSVSELVYEILSSTLAGTVSVQPGGAFSFTFPTDSLGSTFVLRLIAHDWNGNATEVSMTLRRLESNDIPSFSATPGNHQVMLSWEPVPLTESYNIYYAADGSPPSAQVGEKLEDVASGLPVTGLVNGSLYTFILEAVSQVEDKDNWSDFVVAIPLSPYTLMPKVRQSYGAVELTWCGITGFDELEVYRSIGRAGPYVNVSGTVSANRFVDTTCEADVRYFYKVEPAMGNAIRSAPAYAMASVLDSPRLEMVGGIATMFTSFTWVRATDNWLYVLAHPMFSSALLIQDITDPGTPADAGSVELANSGRLMDIAIDGGIAYVVGTDRFYVVSVDDKDDPSVLGSCAGFSQAQGVAAAGANVCVADGDQGLRFIDVTAVDAPFVDTTLATTGFSYSVAISGDYAYVADGDSGVQIVQLSSRSLLTPVDTSGNAQSVAILNDFAYVADGDGGLTIVDISVPANAGVWTTVDTPGNAVDVTISNGYAYVADSTGGLVEVGIGDPDSPAPFVAAIDGTLANAESVTSSGDYMYPLDGGGSLVPISVFWRNSGAPKASSAGVIGSVAGTPLDTDGTYLYAGGDDGVLRIVDRETGNQVGEYATPGPKVLSVVLCGEYAIVASGGLLTPSAIEFVDAHDVTQPAVGPTFLFDDTMFCPCISGDYAYAVGTEGLVVFDVSTPSTAAIAAEYSGIGWGLDAAIQGNQLYVAAYSSGLKIVDVSNLDSIRLLGSLQLPGVACSVVADGNYAYVGTVDPDYVHVVDLSDPRNPVALGQCAPGGTRLTLDGEYLLTATGGFVIDVSNPAAPYPFQRIPRPCSVGDFANLIVAGSSAYFASSCGIQVVDLIE